MFHRSDSDVPVPYGRIKRKIGLDKGSDSTTRPDKTKVCSFLMLTQIHSLLQGTGAHEDCIDPTKPSFGHLSSASFGFKPR